jgi:hypothetical protein
MPRSLFMMLEDQGKVKSGDYGTPMASTVEYLYVRGYREQGEDVNIG